MQVSAYADEPCAECNCDMRGSVSHVCVKDDNQANPGKGQLFVHTHTHVHRDNFTFTHKKYENDSILKCQNALADIGLVVTKPYSMKAGTPSFYSCIT